MKFIIHMVLTSLTIKYDGYIIVFQDYTGVILISGWVIREIQVLRSQNSYRRMTVGVILTWAWASPTDLLFLFYQYLASIYLFIFNKFQFFEADVKGTFSTVFKPLKQLRSIWQPIGMHMLKMPQCPKCN